MQLSSLSLALTAIYGSGDLTISQLLPAGAGRVAAIYTDPAKPSYDECIQKNMDALGPDLVVNGGFDAGLTGWQQTGTNWSAASGYAASDGTNGYLYQTVPDLQGKVVVVTFTVVAPGTVGTLQVSLNNGGATTTYPYTQISTGQVLTTIGRKTLNSSVYFFTTTGWNGAIGNISVREIDLSKCALFSDAAGQTPVVYPIGAGKGKGLLLDRSAGLVLGSELATTYTTVNSSGTSPTLPATLSSTASGTCGLRTPAFVEPFKKYKVTASWVGNTANRLVRIACGGDYTLAGSTATAGTLSAILGGETPTEYAWVYFTATASDQGFVVTEFSVKELPGHHQQQRTAAARGEFSRRYNQLLATATLATQSITAIATQYRLSFAGAGTVTLSGAATGVYSAGSHTITCTAGSLTLTVAGEVLTADLRFEADATIGLPVYQRVTTASDYDETGFPTYWRAQTDDWAKTHINPNGATKSYVFWAGQKMSDAALGVILEVGQTSGAGQTNGALTIWGPITAGVPDVAFRSKGTVLSTSSAGGVPAPMRIGIVGVGDITNDICDLVVNGTTTSSASDQGTGTYLESNVYFGSRAGTSLFANIREYAPPTILFLQPTDSLSANHLAKLQKGYAKAVGVTL
ncbi:MAG: hypothetical protein RBT55_13435 [Rhodocyclaceae bacterium]|jgi:hypothetical protein|nr:hypothetical protein [Rhodocyclaceae bacterium]